MGSTTAKAFLEIAGVPMAIYSLRTLARVPDLTSIILVVAPDQQSRANEMVNRYRPWAIPIHLVSGGAERQDSVAAGLSLVEETVDLVLVHDAARPFVPLSCITACIGAAAADGAAIVAMPARDTVKVVESGRIVRTLERGAIWLAQTPQGFRTPLLRDAYEQARQAGHTATDDATLVEWFGAPVHVVEGHPVNRKITTPDDLQWAEWHVRAEHATATP